MNPRYVPGRPGVTDHGLDIIRADIARTAVRLGVPLDREDIDRAALDVAAVISGRLRHDAQIHARALAKLAEIGGTRAHEVVDTFDGFLLCQVCGESADLRGTLGGVCPGPDAEVAQ